MERRPGGPARFLTTHHFIAVVTLAVLIALVITGFAWANKGVTVVVDGRERYVNTKASDVSALLAEEGVSFADGDVVSPEMTTGVRDGMTVVVRHAVPLTLRLGGEVRPLRVLGRTVADAMVAAGVTPGPDVHVVPSADTPLTPGMTVDVADAFLRVLKQEEPVPFGVKVVQDSRLPAGGRRVVRAGIPGKLLRVFEVVVSGGLEGRPVLRAEQVVASPVPQVVAVGRAAVTFVSMARPAARRTDLGTAPFESHSRLRMESTAYAPRSNDSRTATGGRAAFGIAAVDPSVIPLGSRLYVPGYGFALAADTGSAIKGHRIDLCFDTQAEAIAWGRRWVLVIVLE